MYLYISGVSLALMLIIFEDSTLEARALASVHRMIFSRDPIEI